MQPNHTTRHAFTLVELLVIIGIVALLIWILLPALGTGGHRSPPNVVAQSNLRFLTAGAMNYAGDSDDLLFGFTWDADTRIVWLTSLPKPDPTTQNAAAFQVQNILHRATGRISGDARMGVPSSQLVYLRYSHLVLLDYLTDRQPEPIAASPYDKNLINWQEHPLAYLQEENNFPYGQGLPTKAGYDTDPTWTDPAILQLWPFGSSYQVVPHAWLSDTDPQYTPSPTSPHHMIRQADEDTPLGGRKLTEVAHPSGKVFMYEEFDHQSKSAPLYVSDPNAKANLAFFDGSVRQEKTSAANSAHDKDNPSAVWQQPYLPLDTFPLPAGGLNDQTKLDLRFRWTKNGLAGIDYP